MPFPCVLLWWFQKKSCLLSSGLNLAYGVSRKAKEQFFAGDGILLILLFACRLLVAMGPMCTAFDALETSPKLLDFHGYSLGRVPDRHMSAFTQSQKVVSSVLSTQDDQQDIQY